MGKAGLTRPVQEGGEAILFFLGWRDDRGFTLTELIVAALVFCLVGLAMGGYYVWGVRRVEEGVAAVEVQRNGQLALQAMGETIREAHTYQIPAEGETSGSSSITVAFCPEPYDDENLNGQWDASGAQGLCAPRECFQDLNGNNTCDAVRSPRSFRVNTGGLEVREGDINAPWEIYLDDRYPESEASSVRVDELIFTPEAQDPDTVHIRLVLRDDFRTPGDPGDDLTQAFELTVQREG